MCLQFSHKVLDKLIIKTEEHPDMDWHEYGFFTFCEYQALQEILDIWCPELSERLWDIEYADLYGNELFMDHSSKPIQVQNIYAKLRYLFVKEQ